MILTFSFIFYSLNTDETATYFSILATTYGTTLGNSNTDGYSKLEWFFFVLITLFNFIIMLNLLISILSDTYGRVKENQIVADSQELASMIIEVEMMMFWRVKGTEKHFLHVCRDENSVDSTDDRLISTKFRTMSEKCKTYNHIIQENLNELNYIKSDLEERNYEFKDIIDQIKRKYKLDTGKRKDS